MNILDGDRMFRIFTMTLDTGHGRTGTITLSCNFSQHQMSLVCRAQHCSMMACTISQMIIWIINNNPALLAQSCKYIYSSSWRPSSAHSSRTPDTAYEASMIHDAVSSAGVGVVLWHFIFVGQSGHWWQVKCINAWKKPEQKTLNISYKYLVVHH